MQSILVPLMQTFRREFEEGGADSTDAQLLERYARHRDPVSFELLCWRHGPMVRGVCRRMLPGTADAEDAYQAVFVVLSQRTPHLKAESALAGWLHRVAWRTAANARRASQRRKNHEAKVARPSSAANDPAEAASRRETLQIIDAAIARLPARYREPFVLCELEGRPRGAAARELGIPIGTLDSRLTRARMKLQSRLRLLALPSLLAGSGVVATATPALASASPHVLHLAAGFGAIAVKKALIGATAAAVLLAGATYGTGMFGQDKKVEPPKKIAEVKEVPALPEKNYIDPAGAPLPPGAVARIGSQRFLHAAAVVALAYSPNGKLLASGSLDATDACVRVWEAETGREVFAVPLPEYKEFSSPNVQIIGLGFSPDGGKLFVLAPEEIRVWDVAGKVELAKFDLPGYPKGIRDNRWLSMAAVAPDGRTALMARRLGRMEVRSLVDGKILREVANPLPDYEEYRVEFSADGSRFLLPDGSLYDSKSLGRTGSIPGWVESYSSGPRFLDGGRLAVHFRGGLSGVPKEIAILDVASGKAVVTGAVEDSAFCLEIARDGKTIAVGNRYKDYADILDTATLKKVGRLPIGPNIRRFLLSPDGHRLAGFRYHDAAVKLWDWDRRELHPASADARSYSGARFAADGKTLVLEGLPGRPVVDWRTGKATGKTRRSIANEYGDDAPVAPVYSPDDKFVIRPKFERAKTKGTLEVVDAESAQIVHTLVGHTHFVYRTAFSADGKRLATGGLDKVIFVWDLTTGQRVARLMPPGMDGNEQLILSRDGKRLFTSSGPNPMQGPKQGNGIAVWDVDAGRQLLKFEAPTPFSSNVAASADGRYLAGGGGRPGATFGPVVAGNIGQQTESSGVSIWSAETGKELHSLPGHGCKSLFPGAYCHFSPDSCLLVTGDELGRLRLWETATGREVFSFDGHKSQVYPTFSPDGKFLLTTSREAPCYIWEVVPAKAPKPDPETAWKDLIDADAKKAFAAVRSLAANPDVALALLGTKLKRDEVDGEKVTRWLADLESPRFATREEASKQLAAVAETIEVRLRKARETAPVESKARLDKIIADIGQPTPERLRLIRAVQVLAFIGTPEALKIAERAK